MVSRYSRIRTRVNLARDSIPGDATNVSMSGHRLTSAATMRADALAKDVSSRNSRSREWLRDEDEKDWDRTVLNAAGETDHLAVGDDKMSDHLPFAKSVRRFR